MGRGTIAVAKWIVNEQGVSWLAMQVCGIIPGSCVPGYEISRHPKSGINGSSSLAQINITSMIPALPGRSV
jgi:hypothetical protein